MLYVCQKFVKSEIFTGWEFNNRLKLFAFKLFPEKVYIPYIQIYNSYKLI
jgi:hypothetical protein